MPNHTDFAAISDSDSAHCNQSMIQKEVVLNRLLSLYTKYKPSADQWKNMTGEVGPHLSKIMSLMDLCEKMSRDIKEAENAMSDTPRPDNYIIPKALMFAKMMAGFVGKHIDAIPNPQQYLLNHFFTLRNDQRQYEVDLDEAFNNVNVAIDALQVALEAANENAPVSSDGQLQEIGGLSTALAEDFVDDSTGVELQEDVVQGHEAEAPAQCTLFARTDVALVGSNGCDSLSMNKTIGE